MGSTWISDIQQFKDSQSHISRSLIRSQYCNLVLIFQRCSFHLVGSLFCRVRYPSFPIKRRLCMQLSHFLRLSLACRDSKIQTLFCILCFLCPILSTLPHLLLKMLWAFCESSWGYSIR